MADETQSTGMDDGAAVEVVRRWDKLDGERGTWKAHWQDVLDHVAPRRANVTTTRAPGEKRTEKQFDGTAGDAVDDLVALIFNDLTSPAVRWLTLKALGIEKDRNAAAWLDDSIDMLLAEYRRSNLYQQLLEAYVDMVTVGTAALFSEEAPLTRRGFNGFAFRTLPIAEYVIDTDHQGRVDTVYRKFELTARQAVQKWGPGAVGKSVREAYEDERKRDTAFEFIHAVRPADDTAWPAQGLARLPVESLYVAVKDKLTIERGGYAEMPLHVARWSTASGEKWGRSPSMKALPFVRVLNLIVRYGLEALPRALYPPLLVKEGTIVGGTLRLTPGAQNQFDGRETEKPTELTTQANFSVEEAKEEAYRERIERCYGVDQIRLRDGPQMTAEEVIERRSRRLQALAPVTGLIVMELLKPLVERTWMMMFRAGAFGEPPAALRHAEEIEIVFEGPLARVQRLGRVEPGQDALRTLAPLAQVNPAVMDHFDLDDYSRDVIAASGAGKYLIEDRQVRERRQRQAEELQRQQQLAAGLDVADSAAKMAAAQAAA